MKKILFRKLRVFAMGAIVIVPAVLSGQTYQWDFCSAGTTGTPTTGTAASNDYAKGITLDGRGNSYVVGSFGSSNTSTATFGSTVLTSSGGSDIFIEKLNRLGASQWVVQGKGTHDDDARSVAVYPDGTGGVNTYVTGYFQGSVTFTSTNATTVTLNTASGVGTDWDMYIVKYDNAGVVQWANGLGNATGTDLHIGYDIVVKYNGNASVQAVCIWVVGSYMGTTSFGPGFNITAGAAGKQNGYIACYLDGALAPTLSWANAVKGTNTIQELGVDADVNGISYVTGYELTTGTFGTTSGSTITVAPNGGDDGTVSRYTGLGVLTTADNWGSTSGSAAGTVGKGIAVGQDGSVYVVGTFTNTSSFLASGISVVSTGGNDAFLMQLDNAMTTVNYVNPIFSLGTDDAARVAVDNCGQRCYVTGSYSYSSTSASLSFGNGVSIAPYSASAATDAYLADFDAATGNAIAATRAGRTTNSYTDQGFDVSVNSVEDIVYCGSFTSSTITFDPSGTSVLTNGGLADGFVARWDHSDWPAYESSTCHAVHQGVSSLDCADYAVGDMTGTVSFGTFTNTSSATITDVYLMECDKYAGYQNFVRLTSGSSAETSKDLVSDGVNSFHYVAGSAVTGASQSGVTFVNDATDSYTNTAPASNAIVIKSDLSGNIGATGAWATSVRPGASGAANGEGVAYDSNGNVYFCGYYTAIVTAYNAGGTTTGSAGALTASSGGTDIFVIKYDQNGQIKWKRRIGGTGNDAALAISVDASGTYYYITGYYSGTVTFANAHTSTGNTDGYVMRGDASDANGGIPINEAVFGSAGSNDGGTDVYSNGITEIYVTGQIAGNEAYVASYDLTGTASPSATWTFNSTGGTASGSDILLGGQGYVYVTGYVSGTTASFGSTNYSVTCAYVIGLASWNGALTWTSAAYDEAVNSNGLAEDLGSIGNDHGYIVLFGGSAATGGCTKAYLHKATQEGCELTSRIGQFDPIADDAATPATASATIYPNPFSNIATLRLQESIDPSVIPVSLTILDMTGRIVKQIDGITSRESTIPAEEFVNGVYFYEVTQNGNIVSTGKMMINK
jgi:hypothetical protein